jgi:hypothetical protein
MTNRRAPLAVPYPTRARYEIVLRLPFDLHMTPESTEAHATAFRLSFASAYASRRLSYAYEISTRASAIDATELRTHAADFDKARELLVRSLTYAPPIPDGPNWLLIALVAAALPVLGWGAHRAYEYNPPSSVTREPDPPLAGIRGWLNFLGIGLFIQPFLSLAAALADSRIVFSLRSWGRLVSPSLPTYSPALAALALVELLWVLATGAYACALLLIFLGRRRSFPLHFTVYAIGMLVFQAVDIACVRVLRPTNALPVAGGAWLLMLGVTAAWIAYLRTSRRAAATFVN